MKGVNDDELTEFVSMTRDKVGITFEYIYMYMYYMYGKLHLLLLL